VENLGSVVTQQKTDLIVKVVGKINGVVGTFLIDSGATTEFIDEEYLKKAGLTASGSATRIRLADGVTSKSLGVVNCVRYSLGLEKGGGGAGKKYADRFEVTKLSGYDAILGISWMLQSRLRFLYHRRPLGVAVVTRTVNGIDKYQALQLATGAGSGSIESQVASLGREQVEAAVAELERAAAAAESTGEERARITKVREVAEQIEKDPKPDHSRGTAGLRSAIEGVCRCVSRRVAIGTTTKATRFRAQNQVEATQPSSVSKTVQIGTSGVEVGAGNNQRFNSEGIHQAKPIKVWCTGVIHTEAGWIAAHGGGLQGVE
jgi:hypothetical protein